MLPFSFNVIGLFVAMYTYLQEKKNLVFGKEKVYLALCEKKLFSLNLYAFSDGDPGGFRREFADLGAQTKCLI